jgi:hypothetical protein
MQQRIVIHSVSRKKQKEKSITRKKKPRAKVFKLGSSLIGILKALTSGKFLVL